MMGRALVILVLSILIVGALLQVHAAQGAAGSTAVSTVPKTRLADLKVLDHGEGFTTDPSVAVPAPSPQERVNTLKNAFLHLPVEELERLGLSFLSTEVEVEAGSIHATQLFAAWEQRQTELQQLMAAVVKPAEHMAKIVKQLMTLYSSELHITEVVKRVNQTESARTQEKRGLLQSSVDDTDLLEGLVDSAAKQKKALSLIDDLESLLSDIDNARDFHTLGAVPYLAALTHSRFPAAVRARAIWALGTMVKSDYDYQLYLLEPFAIASNDLHPVTEDALSLILRAFQSSAAVVLRSTTSADSAEQQELLKKSLYALSAAQRGNVDVQERLLNDSDGFLSILIGLARAAVITDDSTHSDHARKVWAIVSDALLERSEIREELLSLAQETQLSIDTLRRQLQLLNDRLALSDKANNESSAAGHEESRARHGDLLKVQQSLTSKESELQAVRNAKDTLRLLGDEIMDAHKDTFQTLLRDTVCEFSRRFIKLAAESLRIENVDVIRELAKVDGILRATLDIAVSHRDLLADSPTSDLLSCLRKLTQQREVWKQDVDSNELLERHDEIFVYVDQLMAM